jgi:hypothetical protein
LETLDELGYIPLHFKGDDILYESIIKCFESLGKSTCNAILNHLCSICGLSEKELLTNCEVFEKVLNNVFGRTAVRLLDMIKRELLLNAVSSNKCKVKLDFHVFTLTINEKFSFLYRLKYILITICLLPLANN